MLRSRRKKINYENLPKEVQQAYDVVRIPGQDFRQCISTLRGIAREYPGFVLAQLDLAALLLETGDTAAAKETYNRVAKRYPSEQGAIAGLATVLAAEGDYAEAERLAQQALENGYSWAPCYGVIAEAREARGDTAGAAEAYLAGYQLSPHAWNYLQHYCRLAGRDYVPPTEEVEPCITVDQLKSLSSYIDKATHALDASGKMPGCDNTFRFTTEWAEEDGVDHIALYQFLNAHSAFCDCEVCLNIEPSALETKG